MANLKFTGDAGTRLFVLPADLWLGHLEPFSGKPGNLTRLRQYEFVRKHGAKSRTAAPPEQTEIDAASASRSVVPFWKVALDGFFALAIMGISFGFILWMFFSVALQIVTLGRF